MINKKNKNITNIKELQEKISYILQENKDNFFTWHINGEVGEPVKTDTTIIFDDLFGFKSMVSDYLDNAFKSISDFKSNNKK